MTRNDKTRHAGRVCQCAEKCLICDCKITIPPKPMQPIPGTALCSFLRRYRLDVEQWKKANSDPHSQKLIDCCTTLLDSVERGQHGA